MEKVLIIGANGATGRIVATQLKDSSNYIPIAMIRNEDQRGYFEELGVQTRIGDLEGDISDCFEAVDKVVFVAGSGSSTGKDKTEKVDKEGAEKSIDLAKEYEIKKYVMLSARGTEDPDPESKMLFYLAAKSEADEYLKKSGVPYAIVRAGALTDDEGNGKIKAAYKLEGEGQIPRADVAKTLIASLDRDYGTGLTFEIVSGEEDIQNAIEHLRQV
ncbi:SDR family oxidoreductase [Anditalea andensis]|uniref:NAD-dependent dehydratase n=1 Tax=Anditalea andensis TaxID=1048983 RepID=A0A074L1Q8_9BACT|nr:SDR family oxidoreductase [Anditalea andensis]KEO75089.1 NAD-dependent dehydratase [Anditalea andensis]